jgi:hypothetical protein
MNYLWLIVRGAVIWLVPFVVSVFFYTPAGELVTSYALFKSVMVLLLTLAVLLVNLVRPPTTSAPTLVGVVYLAVNLLLDMLVVIPLTGLTPLAYIEQIGLIYLLIPVLTVVVLRSRATPLNPHSTQHPAEHA